MTAISSPPAHAAKSPAPQPAPRRKKTRGTAASLWEASPLTYFGLIIGIVISAFPIVWSFIIASRDNSDINTIPPPLTPGPNFGENVQRLLDNEDASFLIGLANSFIVSSIVTLSVVIFSTLAGFAFAKLRFRGKNAMLLIIILTMMIPTQLGVIPLYLLMVDFGWNNTLQAVIVPFMVKGFGVFMMRQYTISAVPDELIEAGRMDGCSTWRVYWNVVLPAVRPAAGVLGLLTFMETWNDFLWPYIVLNNNTPTVQISLKILASGYYQTDYAMIFTGTSLALVPLLLVFLAFGKQIIGGIMEGSVKA
ncbi:MAG: carbohydrate ABC transporter permease [Micromonosporaceae bacterium]|nr:carbohydrate ABC transporter permease [Micromonosporaceae bacterium]